MRLRALNEAGLQAFGTYLVRAANERQLPPPLYLLDDPGTSYEVGGAVEAVRFANKLDAARYLEEVLKDADPAEVQRGRGLWAWLTLYYFDQLVQRTAQGRKVLAVERYIPSGHYQREYRHLLQGPYKLYLTHRDGARVLLHKPLHVWSDLEEQLIGVQEVIQIPGLMGAVHLLYYDPAKEEAKRGVTNRKKGGTVRRLRDVLQQLELTYDIYSISGEEILNLLPAEFDRFRPAGVAGTSSG